MACKHLITVTAIIPGGSEVGGPITPQGIPMPACKLRRNPDWLAKCGETPTNGPCWLWVEKYGDLPDRAFDTN